MANTLFTLMREKKRKPEIKTKPNKPRFISFQSNSMKRFKLNWAGPFDRRENGGHVQKHVMRKSTEAGSTAQICGSPFLPCVSVP